MARGAYYCTISHQTIISPYKYFIPLPTFSLLLFLFECPSYKTPEKYRNKKNLQHVNFPNCQIFYSKLDGKC
jgi:hypothetical protein